MSISKIKNSAPIAFFDSGVGGLTVFSKVKKLLPNENFLYYGDTLHMPYGEKSKEDLIKYADAIFNFFEEKGAKAVVMACNTTSAATYDVLKDNYKFKVYPIIQSCAKVFADLPINRLGIFATGATIRSGVYENEIKKHNSNIEIYAHACPEWVKIVEGGMENNPESRPYIKEHLEKMLEFKPDKIILGCTHYPYLLDVLSEFAPRELFIDPAVYFAKSIKADLERLGLMSISYDEPYEKFFVSSNPQGFKDASGMFYQLAELPKLVDLKSISV